MSELSEAYGSLSVVIPAYNAGRDVVSTLDSATRWLDEGAVPYEIIVVDDGSTDRTYELASSFREDVRAIKLERNRGKGYAVRTGVLAARNDWVLFMDVDHSTDIRHLRSFAERAGEADVLIASRRLHGADIVRRQPRIRQTMGRTFPYIVRLLALPGISDTQCGFKLFRRSAARAIFSRQRIDRFAFDVEVLMIARLLNLRIVEMPVAWDNPTGSTVRVGWDSIQMFCDVIRLALTLRGRRTKDVRLPASSESPT